MRPSRAMTTPVIMELPVFLGPRWNQALFYCTYVLDVAAPRAIRPRDQTRACLLWGATSARYGSTTCRVQGALCLLLGSGVQRGDRTLGAAHHATKMRRHRPAA